MSNYYGKCVSTHGKVTKGGVPKHSGNFSYQSMHYQSLQSRDYPVREKDGKLIVGDHTPLYELMPIAVYELAVVDEQFESVCRKCTVVVDGKEYEGYKTLTRRHYSGAAFSQYDFVYREQVYTDFEIEVEFTEY